MTGKAAIWKLLLDNENNWVPRDEIAAAGGLDGLRRLREVKREAPQSGFAVESDNEKAFRVIRIIKKNDTRPRCLKCNTVALTGYHRTVDPRWVKGKCVVCDDKEAIFRVVEGEP